MSLKKKSELLLAMLTVSFCLFSCSKKGNFINEGKVGSGIHYYPIILNNALRDTITRKYLNSTDTIFSPGQKIVFELDYLSQNPIAILELWAGKSPNDLAKVRGIPYQNSFLSPTKFADTVLFKYDLPVNLDSLSIRKWYLEPRVITAAGLQSSMNVVIRIR